MNLTEHEAGEWFSHTATAPHHHCAPALNYLLSFRLTPASHFFSSCIDAITVIGLFLKTLLPRHFCTRKYIYKKKTWHVDETLVNSSLIWRSGQAFKLESVWTAVMDTVLDTKEAPAAAVTLEDVAALKRFFYWGNCRKVLVMQFTQGRMRQDAQIRRAAI